MTSALASLSVVSLKMSSFSPPSLWTSLMLSALERQLSPHCCPLGIRPFKRLARCESHLRRCLHKAARSTTASSRCLGSPPNNGVIITGTLIVWNDGDEKDEGTDLSLSFQEASGCDELWFALPLPPSCLPLMPLSRNTLIEVQENLRRVESLGASS